VLDVLGVPVDLLVLLEQLVLTAVVFTYQLALALIDERRVQRQQCG